MPDNFTLNSNSGRVECVLCQTNWCDHMHKMIGSSADSDMIWVKDPAADYLEFIYLEIPMFPSINLWTMVNLTLNKDAPIPMYRVEWPFLTCTEGRIGHSLRFICNITQGEGRKIIRTCLIEYMYGDPGRKKECASHAHGPYEEKVWQQHQKTLDHFSEDWCVYTTDACLTCLKKFDPLNIPDDLVPDKQNVWS